MKKKSLAIVGLFLSVLIFFGCATKQDLEEDVVAIEVPATMEGRVAASEFLPVTDVAQLTGKWIGSYSQTLSEAEGVPFSIVLNAEVSLEYPYEIEGMECISYVESADYTEYLEKTAEVYQIEPEAIWSSMQESLPQAIYSESAPYIFTVVNYIDAQDPTLGQVISVKTDGSQIKLTNGPMLTIILDKQID